MVHYSEKTPGISHGKAFDLQHMSDRQVEGWINERTARLKEVGFETPMGEVVKLVQHGVGEMYEDIRAADGTMEPTGANLLMAMWTLDPSRVQSNLGDFTQIATDVYMGVRAWRDKTGGVGLPQSLVVSPVEANR